MKRKDMALIVVVIFISAIMSLLLSKVIFGSPKTQQQKVEVAQKITSKFDKADKRYFNEQAFNPTKRITVGGAANPDPFKDPKR